MTGRGVHRLHGGDSPGASVLPGAVVLDRGGGHDGEETKLHFHFRVLGT